MVRGETEDKDDVVSWRMSLQRQKKMRLPGEVTEVTERWRKMVRREQRRGRRVEGQEVLSRQNSSAVRLGQMAGKDE